MSGSTRTSSPSILETVGRYYSDRLEQYGPTPKGVDWNSPESQTLRFNRLLLLLDPVDPARPAASLIDYGCGYGALADYLDTEGRVVDYLGFDISEAMVQAARSVQAGRPRRSFTSEIGLLTPADYAVASGIFNVRLHHGIDEWQTYVWETVAVLNQVSTRGFSFNMLSTYSDVEKRRDDLFYVDPREAFDTCKRRFSSRVALLHDYPLHEFTILVRK